MQTYGWSRTSGSSATTMMTMLGTQESAEKLTWRYGNGFRFLEESMLLVWQKVLAFKYISLVTVQLLILIRISNMQFVFLMTVKASPSLGEISLMRPSESVPSCNIPVMVKFIPYIGEYHLFQTTLMHMIYSHPLGLKVITCYIKILKSSVIMKT